MKNENGEEIEYICEKCGDRNNATKSTTFESEPEILVIHLRLFMFNEATKENHNAKETKTSLRPRQEKMIMT